MVFVLHFYDGITKNKVQQKPLNNVISAENWSHRSRFPNVVVGIKIILTVP